MHLTLRPAVLSKLQGKIVQSQAREMVVVSHKSGAVTLQDTASISLSATDVSISHQVYS
jgi:hypothetical protein